MIVVVDASIAVKWYLEQPGWRQAREVAASKDDLIAPELILAETASALWRNVRAGVIRETDATEVLQKLPLRFERFAALQSLTGEAMRLALDIGHPIYDCYYLALAEREKAPLVTADLKLAKAARDVPGLSLRTLTA